MSKRVVEEYTVYAHNAGDLARALEDVPYDAVLLDMDYEDTRFIGETAARILNFERIIERTQ